MTHFKSEKLLLLLVFLTLCALAFRPLILRKTLEIKTKDTFVTRLDSDKLDQGNSTVRWIDKNNYEWECELKPGYGYPFCTFQLYLKGNYMDGVDLSGYDKMLFWLDYEGPGKTVRVFLRNSNPAYTSEDRPRSAKFNTVELKVDEINRETVLDLIDFRVADWWILMFDIPLRHSHPELDNVSMIEFQTGSGSTEGIHRFRFRGARFQGQWMSTEQWYFIIIILWLTAILVYLGYRILSLNAEVKMGRLRQKELSEINAILDKRSRALEEKSKIDPLTGAFNRRGLDSVVYDSVRKWKREKSPLTLILFDVDHFKSINDNYGHKSGDEVLVSLSNIVKENIRKSDRFARWGGEEFIIVSIDTTAGQGYDLADKIRRVVEEAVFGKGMRVTVSFGVAEIRENEALEELFERADKALFEAKTTGRNRVCLG